MKRGEEETGDGEGGDRERKRGRLAHVQGYHWQKSRHLPAASWRQQHSARRMLPCAASVGAGVFRLGLCVCVHSVDAAELHQCVKAQGKDHMQKSAALTEGTALKNRKKSAVTVAPSSAIQKSVHAHFCQIAHSPERRRDEGSRLKTSP